MPAHWLLARLGKTVMRPGGLPVTRAMLDGLAVGRADHVLDIAPGLGVTVGLVADARPASFRGIERGAIEAQRARRLAGDVPYTCVVAEPEATGLPSGSMSVVYGEAVLSLETNQTKQAIIAEAARLLRPAGRIGLHELLLQPPDLDEDCKARLQRDLTTTLRVRARPLTLPEWRALLDDGGLRDHRRANCATPAPLPANLRPGRGARRHRPLRQPGASPTGGRQAARGDLAALSPVPRSPRSGRFRGAEALNHRDGQFGKASRSLP